MTADDVAAPPPAPDHARRTLLIASVAAFAVFLDTTALFVAFPDITTSFPDVAPSQLSWVLNGYTIVFAALLVPLGKLADRRGHKQMFLAGVAVVHGRLAAVRDRAEPGAARRRPRRAGRRRCGARAVVAGAHPAIDAPRADPDLGGDLGSDRRAGGCCRTDTRRGTRRMGWLAVGVRDQPARRRGDDLHGTPVAP